MYSSIGYGSAGVWWRALQAVAAGRPLSGLRLADVYGLGVVVRWALSGRLGVVCALSGASLVAGDRLDEHGDCVLWGRPLGVTGDWIPFPSPALWWVSAGWALVGACLLAGGVPVAVLLWVVLWSGWRSLRSPSPWVCAAVAAPLSVAAVSPLRVVSRGAAEVRAVQEVIGVASAPLTPRTAERGLRATKAVPILAEIWQRHAPTNWAWVAARTPPVGTTTGQAVTALPRKMAADGLLARLPAGNNPNAPAFGKRKSATKGAIIVDARAVNHMSVPPTKRLRLPSLGQLGAAMSLMRHLKLRVYFTKLEISNMFYT